MKFIYLICSFSFLAMLSYGQVGMGRENPRGILDLNDNNNLSVFGLVLPAITHAENTKTPQNTEAVHGTIVYDSTKNCIRYRGYKSKNGVTILDDWSDCLTDKIIITKP